MTFIVGIHKIPGEKLDIADEKIILDLNGKTINRTTKPVPAVNIAVQITGTTSVDSSYIKYFAADEPGKYHVAWNETQNCHLAQGCRIYSKSYRHFAAGR